jgi:methyl-accepting chemotaxis protein
MWIHKLPPKREAQHFHRRRSLYMKRQFQVRYILYMAGSLVITLFMAGAPVYFFINQNYKLFRELAHEKAPEILSALENERVWLLRIVTITLLFSTVFFTYFGLKLTSRIVGPLLVLQNHIQRLIMGDLTTMQIKVRENDEFQDLIAAYNYFYLSLRQKTINDLEKLRKVEPPFKDRVAHAYWLDLVNERRYQLNTAGETTSTGANELRSPDSRHAS